MKTAAGLGALTAALLTACGGTGAAGTADPTAYLLQLGQLGTPDFVIQQAPAAAPATALAGPLGGRAPALLKQSGLSSAAQVVYERTTTDIAFSNGPLQISATCAAFSSSSGAANWFTQYTGALAAVANTTPVSTGPLGDSAAGFVRTADDGGVTAVQITVVWRQGNLVNVIVDDGRYGGTRLDDALYLAQRQEQNEGQ